MLITHVQNINMKQSLINLTCISGSMSKE